MSTIEEREYPVKNKLLTASLQRHAESMAHATDALIDSLIEDFYCRLVDVQKNVPEGPGQMTYACLITTCAYVLHIEEPAREMLARLFAQPRHHAAWMEFVDAACADDSIPDALQLTCRYIAAGIWLDGILFGGIDEQKINEVTRFAQGLLLAEKQINVA